MKRDWDGLDAEQKRTAKGKRAATMSVDAPAAYEPEMDEMRCVSAGSCLFDLATESIVT